MKLKKLSILLVCITLAIIVSAGCIPEWIIPGSEDPEIVVPEMVANVDAVLIDEEEEVSNQIAWSIENTGDLFIREYIITFDVFYPMETKDNILITVTGLYLEIGKKHEGILELIEYDTPETVSVSWELFE